MDRLPFLNFYPYFEPTQPTYEGFPGVYYANPTPYMYFIPQPIFNGITVPSTIPRTHQQVDPAVSPAS